MELFTACMNYCDLKIYCTVQSSPVHWFWERGKLNYGFFDMILKSVSAVWLSLAGDPIVEVETLNNWKFWSIIGDSETSYVKHLSYGSFALSNEIVLV